jgi:hypothetical protein
MTAKTHEKGLTLPAFDKRLTKQALRRGLLDRKEYETHLKKLPDDESKGEYVEIVDETTADVDSENGADRDSQENLTFT